METTAVRIDVDLLLRFFDEAPSESRYHATALVALAGEDLGAGLLAHYFRARSLAGATVARCRSQCCRSGWEPPSL